MAVSPPPYVRWLLRWGIGAVAFTILVAGSACQNGTGSPTPEARRVEQALEAAGLEVVSVEVTGDDLTLRLREELPDGTMPTVDDLRRVFAPYRVAATEGMQSVTVHIELPTGETLDSTQSVRPLDAREHMAPEQAQTELSGWMEDVAARTGAAIRGDLDPQTYALTAVVSGGRDQLAAAVEQLMNGGIEQHAAGRLDFLAVTGSMGGQEVYRGIYDYEIGQNTRWTVEGFEVEF